MEDWVKEVLIGAVLLIIGVYLTAHFIGYFIKVLLGVLGPILLVGGLILLWIGVEDKKMTMELSSIEEKKEEKATKEKKKSKK